MRNHLLSASATMALIIASGAVASAQEAAPAAQTGIGEIVVTAQRKEESLQKAAIAIDAVSGSTLIKSGVSGAGELNKLVPALTVANGGGSNTSIYMRGVGNRTNSSYVDPAVTISYDGVFLGRPAGAFGSAFFDLQRVEVLKGPQGILYGRNATGGAINIIPQRPQLGVTHMGFDVSVGNYNAVSAQAYLNLPVGDTMAVRVGATRQVHDGYNADGSSDQDTSGLRAQVLFKPNDDVSVRVGVDYTKIGGQGQGFTYLGNFVPNGTSGNVTGAGNYAYVPSGLSINEGLNSPAANAYRQTLLGAPGFGFLTAMNEKPFNDFTYWGVNAELTWKTGIGTVTILPSYRHSEGKTAFFGPAFNTARFNETDDQHSIEARLSGTRGAVDYILGGYYFHEKIDNNGEYNQEFVLPIQRFVQKTDSLAAFGNLTWHVTDNLRLIGGARYTHDKKDMDGLINNFITFCGGPGPALVTPPASFGLGCQLPTSLPRYGNFLNAGDTVSWLKSNGWIASSSPLANGYQVFPLLSGKGAILKTYDPVVDQGTYSRPTWKLSAQYDLAPRSLVYVTAETGYRAGGFQLAEGRSRYKPEFITAYTIGSKNRFLNNKLQINAEAFLWKYTDQQISYFTVDNSGTLINSTENAGKVTIKGLDVDVIAKPFSGTTLGGKVQYLDATYDDLHLRVASPRENFNCPTSNTGTLLSDGVTPVLDVNCSGRVAQYAPKWTVNLTAEQRVPVSEGIDLYGRVATSWRSQQYGGFEYLEFEKIPAYWQTDLEAGLQGSHWTLSVFVRNLEDKRRVVAPTLAPSGQAVAMYSAPQTYGLRLSADF